MDLGAVCVCRILDLQGSTISSLRDESARFLLECTSTGTRRRKNYRIVLWVNIGHREI